LQQAKTVGASKTSQCHRCATHTANIEWSHVRDMEIRYDCVCAAQPGALVLATKPHSASSSNKGKEVSRTTSD